MRQCACVYRNNIMQYYILLYHYTRARSIKLPSDIIMYYIILHTH